MHGLLMSKTSTPKPKKRTRLPRKGEKKDDLTPEQEERQVQQRKHLNNVQEVATNSTTPNKVSRLAFINPMIRHLSTKERYLIEIGSHSIDATQAQARHKAPYSIFENRTNNFSNFVFYKIDHNSYMKRVNSMATINWE